MDKREFYQNAVNNSGKITWREIFSDFYKKHSKQDMEYAMLTGSSLDRATPANMLQKWRKPWLFWRVLLIGLALAVGDLLLMHFSNMMTGNSAMATVVVFVVIAPAVAPLALMIFFWELNIPRNISIYVLLAAFLIGGIISFFITGLLFSVFPTDMPASIGAPLREEPAKLVSALILLIWFAKKSRSKVYGLTGLVIGAAVGTGFSIFESIEYGMGGSIETIFMRMIFSVVGHTLYCAPYMAAIALHMKDNKFSVESFINMDFGLTFIGSCLLHGFWDTELVGGSRILEFAFIPVVWLMVLYIVRKCIQQAVIEGTMAGGGFVPYAGYQYQQQQYPQQPFPQQQYQQPVRQVSAPAGMACLTCIAGDFAGSSIPFMKSEIRIGREESCDYRFTGQSGGISRTHCMIQFDASSRSFLLYDLGSSYGTFLADGTRIVPGQPARLTNGSEFFLAQNAARFRVTC